MTHHTASLQVNPIARTEAPICQLWTDNWFHLNWLLTWWTLYCSRRLTISDTQYPRTDTAVHVRRSGGVTSKSTLVHVPLGAKDVCCFGKTQPDTLVFPFAFSRSRDVLCRTKSISMDSRQGLASLTYSWVQHTQKWGNERLQAEASSRSQLLILMSLTTAYKKSIEPVDLRNVVIPTGLVSRNMILNISG